MILLSVWVTKFLIKSLRKYKDLTAAEHDRNIIFCQEQINLTFVNISYIEMHIRAKTTERISIFS